MQCIVGQTLPGLGQPDRAIRVVAMRREIGVLAQQAGLQLVQARTNLLRQIRSRGVRRRTSRLPLREQSVLHQFVRLHLRGDQLGDVFGVELVFGRQGAGIGDDLGFARAVLNRLAAVPFGQGDEVAEEGILTQLFPLPRWEITQPGKESEGAPRASNVVDLAELLKQSLGGRKPGATKTTEKRAAAGRGKPHLSVVASQRAAAKHVKRKRA